MMEDEAAKGKPREFDIEEEEGEGMVVGTD